MLMGSMTFSIHRFLKYAFKGGIFNFHPRTNYIYFILSTIFFQKIYNKFLIACMFVYF